MELCYWIILRDYITESYYKSRLQNCITKLYYRIILRKYITKLNYGTIVRPQKRSYLSKCTAPQAVNCCIRIRSLQRITLRTPMDRFVIYTRRKEPRLVAPAAGYRAGGDASAPAAIFLDAYRHRTTVQRGEGGGSKASSNAPVNVTEQLQTIGQTKIPAHYTLQRNSCLIYP